MTPSLRAIHARLSAFGERGVRRVSVDVSGEQVSFTLREARVVAVCTCAVEGCEHQALAIRLLMEPGEPHETFVAPAAVKHRSSMRPPAAQSEATQLAGAIEELCLATARAGVSAQDSPSIRAALDQLQHAPVQAPSLSLSRFIGRFQNALALGEIGELASLLAGAQAWAKEQERGLLSTEVASRTRAWLGARVADAGDSLTDVTLVELGREWLTGLTRSAIERRYLVDLADGQLYCEERRRADQDVSVGPCPRVVQVSYAALERAVLPPRTNLLQYAITLEPGTEHWQRLAELGEADMSALRTSYAHALEACPGLAEPVVLFAARDCGKVSPSSSLRDASGTRLTLRDDAGAPLGDTVRTLSGEGEVVWLLGRLRLLSSGLALRPISALLRLESGYRLRRIT